MALCISRKRDESLILRTATGLTIKITLADINGGRSCRLAITAPDTVEVVREELLYQTEQGFQRRGKETHGQDIR
jgi:sRNA-binding carbon storage regulator CsrA